MAAPPGIAPAVEPSGGSTSAEASTQRSDPAGPHVDQFGRDQLEDLGLIDDDHTPDMRKAPAATEALRNDNPITHLKGKS